MLAKAGKRAEALIAGVIASGLYLLTLSGNHSETEDSLVFSIRVEEGSPAELFEPHHLIYDWVGWLVYEASKSVGIAGDPVAVLQALDALLGGLIVGLLWLTIRWIGLSRLVAFTAAGLLAFSYGFWRNSVEVEVYALASLTLVIMLAAALRAVDRADSTSFALLGLCHGAAVLAHSTSVLLAGMVVAALVLASRRPSGEFTRMLGAYVATVSVVVAAGYGAAIAVVGIDSPDAFGEWFTSSADPGQYGDASPSALVGEGVVGAARGFIGGHFMLSFDEAQELLAERFPDTPLREERFMVGDFDETLALALAGAAIAAAVLLAVAALRWLRRPAHPPAARRLAILSLAWIVPAAALTAYWNPLDIELWYSSWIPASILLALPLGAVSTGRRSAAAASVALVGLLALVNLLGSQLPQREEERDYWRVRSAWYAANTRPGDVIIANGYLELAYLRHLTEAEVVDAAGTLGSADAMGSLLDSTRRARGRVYVTEETFYPFHDAPGGCAGDANVCVAGEAARLALLERAKRVPAPGPQRIWTLAEHPGAGAAEEDRSRGERG